MFLKTYINTFSKDSSIEDNCLIMRYRESVTSRTLRTSREVILDGYATRFCSPIGECVIPLPLVAPLPPSISLRSLRLNIFCGWGLPRASSPVCVRRTNVLFAYRRMRNSAPDGRSITAFHLPSYPAWLWIIISPSSVTSSKRTESWRETPDSCMVMP